MLNEKFGFSRKMENDSNTEYAVNGIWQCPEMLTVQAECLIEDNRTSVREYFTVFYMIEDEDEWKRELIRILKGLGYDLCMVTNHFIRKITLDAFELHQKGKALED